MSKTTYSMIGVNILGLLIVAFFIADGTILQQYRGDYESGTVVNSYREKHRAGSAVFSIAVMLSDGVHEYDIEDTIYYGVGEGDTVIVCHTSGLILKYDFLAISVDGCNDFVYPQ